MQIHELNSFTGTPGAGDYLVVDDGLETKKLDSTALATIADNVATLHDVLVVTKMAFTSLPQTITNSNITSDMVVVNSILGSPAAQTGDWTVTTSDGSLTVSGSISGSTTLTLYLAKSR